MAAGQGGTYTGFVEGLIKRTGSTFDMLPFADKVGGATLNYTGENIIVETFSAQGVKGASGACPSREELSIVLESDNLAWSFLQAATNTLAVDNDRATEGSVSVVLSQLVSTNSVYTLPFAVSVVGDVKAADEDGVQYPVTATVSGSTTVVTFTGDKTGKKVTIFYSIPAAGTKNLIKVGQGTKLGEVGVYGRFFGCPDSILVAIPRAIIAPTLSMAVGEGAASASLTATALRDNFGNFAYLTRI